MYLKIFKHYYGSHRPIKGYSEYLDNLITKKIHEASLHSNIKKTSAEDEILVLIEEKKNSTKTETRLESELSDLKSKEELYKEYDDEDVEKNVEKFQLQIKNSEK